MPDLIATPALNHAPVERGGATLALTDPGRMTSIAPFAGQEGAVNAALAAIGLGFPGPNAVIAGPAGSIVWTGRAQAFLIGAAPPALDGLADTILGRHHPCHADVKGGGASEIGRASCRERVLASV